MRAALAAVTATLLGSGAIHAEGNNRLESSILLYSEVNRVQAAEGIISLTGALKGDRLFNARFTLDGLTGASPNGATVSSHIQTFTRPSGNGSFSVKPGEIPLDNTFKDTRYGFDGSLTQPVDRLTSVIFGAHLSTEHDYTSLGANVGFTRDFNRKNTTLSVSAAYSHDIVRPLGGAPTPFTSFSAATNDDDGEGHGSGPGMGKNVFDAVLGVTQVLDRCTILRLDYSFDHTSGYLNDPYKLLSVVQGSTASEPGEPMDYLYESRPGSRSKHALYTEMRRYISGHTIDVSYRYFWDDWGIRSHTIDLHYRLPLTAGHAIEPHLRWYRQTGADFYHAFLVGGSPFPAHASADYRLAPLHAMTVGLQYFFPIERGMYLSLGVEYYRQAGDVSPPSSLGILSRSNLFPDMDAAMVRLGFSHDF